MSRRRFGGFLCLGAMLFWALLPWLFANEEEVVDPSVAALEGALYTLDQFMLAGKSEDAETGARLLEMYESSPKKAEREIGQFFEEREAIFSNYVSVSNDVYGYEYKENGYMGPNVDVEGRVETEFGLTAEFSARLVFRGERWRILSLEID